MACDRMRGDFRYSKQQLNADGTCTKCNCLFDEHPEGHFQSSEPVVQDVSTSARSLKRGTELKFCCCVISFSLLSTFREWSFRFLSVPTSNCNSIFYSLICLFISMWRVCFDFSNFSFYTARTHKPPSVQSKIRAICGSARVGIRSCKHL
jgi:hypothetical protein